MKAISICYTILDIIEVPDDFTDDEIQAACEEKWSEYECNICYDDLEWSEIYES